VPRKVQAVDDVARRGEHLGRVPHGREMRVRPVAVKYDHDRAVGAGPGGALEPVHRQIAIRGAKPGILVDKHGHRCHQESGK